MKIRHDTFRKLFPSASSVSVRKTSLNLLPYSQERYLIITADDFGASKNISEGIKIAADKKAITTISAMTNFIESLSELKEISEDHPEIGIGVHLNIITGKPVLAVGQVPSLVNSDGNFYSIETLLPELNGISVDDLRKELRAQILALANFDIKLDHLSDQGGILTLYSPFFEIVMELAREFNVPVRSPVLASVKYPDLFPNSKMNRYGRQIARRFAFNSPFRAIGLLKYTGIDEMEKKMKKLDDLGILHPGLFVESFWGNPTQSNFLHILKHLPMGISEVVLHLGTDTRQENYPSGLDLDYFINREKELITVSENNLKEYISCLNITTIGYSDIAVHKRLINGSK